MGHPAFPVANVPCRDEPIATDTVYADTPAIDNGSTVAARTCMEQILDLRNTLRYLGVPIQGPSIMFGDNQSVVGSATIPDAKLHKRHTALSFHRVREAIASKMLNFYHLKGEYNPADILSKHWGYIGRLFLYKTKIKTIVYSFYQSF